MVKDDPGAGERWHLDYIEDAATKRVDSRTFRGRHYRDSSNYDPVGTGIHLCGQTDDGQQPTTVANYRMSEAEAARLFEVAKSVAQCGPDEDDFVVDLFIGGSCGEDFLSNRQLWPRAIAAWNAPPENTSQDTNTERNGG